MAGWAGNDRGRAEGAETVASAAKRQKFGPSTTTVDNLSTTVDNHLCPHFSTCKGEASLGGERLAGQALQENYRGRAEGAEIGRRTLKR